MSVNRGPGWNFGGLAIGFGWVLALIALILTVVFWADHQIDAAMAIVLVLLALSRLLP